MVVVVVLVVVAAPFGDVIPDLVESGESRFTREFVELARGFGGREGLRVALDCASAEVLDDIAEVAFDGAVAAAPVVDVDFGAAFTEDVAVVGVFEVGVLVDFLSVDVAEGLEVAVVDAAPVALDWAGEGFTDPEPYVPELTI